MYDQFHPHRMSYDTLQELIRQVMTQGQTQVSFGWQGGEPTLMGLPFYQQVVGFQQKYGRNQSVSNGLQTNGLLINDKWAGFLKSYNFLVGVSIDGTEHIHNHYRTFKGGKGSWEKVVHSAKLLLDAGVSVNVLTVVNDYSVDFPEEIYSHHKSLGFDHMQFIPCIELDPVDSNKSADFSLSPEKYCGFLCTLFDLWHNDFKNGQPTNSIRHFDSLLHCYLELEAPECTQKENCGDYLVIEHNGDVYSCDFFVEPACHLGNISRHRLSDMLNSPQQRRFGLGKSMLEDQCKSCRWLKLCYGGCPKDRRHNQQNKNLSAFCQSYQIFFDHADEVLRSLARDLKHAPSPDTSGQAVRPVDQNKVGRNHPCPCGSGKKFKKCCGKLR